MPPKRTHIFSSIGHSFIIKFIAVFVCLITLSACTETELVAHVAKQIPRQSKTKGDFKVGSPYKIAGTWYTPEETYNYSETGIASWYGPQFHGKKTANGETFDMHELTAAHRTLQLPSLVRVTNLENGRSLIVRVNDRGPFSKGRIIDLSKRAAELLDFERQGTAKVRVTVLSEESQRIARAAKRGEDTRGTEIALNEDRFGRKLPSERPASPSVSPPPERVASVEQAALPETIPGHVKGGNFLPDPIIQEVPVTDTGIYVQAGSFGDAANAQSLAGQLGKFGDAKVVPAMVNGRQFYRVRLGPVPNVQQADILLAQLSSDGRTEAMIVVD